MEQAATKRVVRRIASPELFYMPQQAPAKKLIVAAYARVSTEKEQQENSYERQVEHYTALIKANAEWEFGGVYADPGISGTRAEKRPEFMRMMQDCREGKIQKILAKSISRFARNTVDMPRQNTGWKPSSSMLSAGRLSTPMMQWLCGRWWSR